MSFFDLSESQVLILEILRKYKTPMYGLQIIKASKGKLGMGTLYNHLGRLEDAGHVSSKLEPKVIGQMPRRMYEITSDGRTKLMELEASKATSPQCQVVPA